MTASAAALGSATTVAVPLIIARIIDGPLVERRLSGLVGFGLLALLFGVAEAFLVLVRRWTQVGAALGMETAIRKDLYQHLQRLSIDCHGYWPSGQLLSSATSDLFVLRRFLSYGVIFAVVNSMTCVVVLALLFRLSWPLGFLVAVGVLPVFHVSSRFANRYSRLALAAQRQRGDLATLAEESARGIRVIRALGRGRHMTAVFAQSADRLRKTALEKNRLLARCVAQLDLIPNATLAVVLVLGASEVATGSLSVGGLVAFMALQMVLIWPVESLGGILAAFEEATAAANRVMAVLDTPPAVLERPGAVHLQPQEVLGRVRFEGVGFAYPSSPHVPVLSGVDLALLPGETLALVGPTGSGKTTLTALLPRLQDVTSGRITIDGRDIRDLTLASLRSIVGVCLDQPVLFSTSVRENLTLGRREVTDLDITRALTIARAEFVQGLPMGLDTPLGERGMTLSGGQRQRLALARAILGRPKVLVLDDPLSALDIETESEVERALADVLSTTTALLVVHRPSTVFLADRVAFLSSGRVRAVGTHPRLLATVPEYRALLSPRVQA